MNDWKRFATKQIYQFKHPSIFKSSIRQKPLNYTASMNSSTISIIIYKWLTSCIISHMPYGITYNHQPTPNSAKFCKHVQNPWLGSKFHSQKKTVIPIRELPMFHYTTIFFGLFSHQMYTWYIHSKWTQYGIYPVPGLDQKLQHHNYILAAYSLWFIKLISK